MSEFDPDDLDATIEADNDAGVVEGLAVILAVCAELRHQRLALGLGIDDVARRGGCDARAVEWIDDGDVAAPLEALAYYAAAVGLRLHLAVVNG